MLNGAVHRLVGHVIFEDKNLWKIFCRLMREAGPDGLTLEQLSSSVAVSADKARKLLEAALRFGLVQRVGGYQAWAYVAAEHCQRFRPGNAPNFAISQEGDNNTPNFLLPELLLVEDVHVSCIKNGLYVL